MAANSISSLTIGVIVSAFKSLMTFFSNRPSVWIFCLSLYVSIQNKVLLLGTTYWDLSANEQ